MARYEIMGGTPLSGEVTISGAKNAAVAILPAALLVADACRIENVPDISDVRILLDILKGIGAKVSYEDRNTVIIDSSEVNSVHPDPDLVRKMRASYYLMGALLGRFGRADVALPGGCNFASRPIDQHIKGFLALGADVDETEDYVAMETGVDGLHGAKISLDMASVGATANIMLAAVLIPGQTIIENAAKEPHIVDLANFLNTMGARISGAGTDTVKVRGVDKLRGGTYAIIPDQIEAGTYLAAVTAAGGNVLVKNVIPKHLESITAKLLECGVNVTEYDDSVRVQSDGKFKKINLKTMPHPGFPTDMQPQMAVLLSVAEGTSLVSEGVWDNRFKYIDQLVRMGAHVQVDGTIAVFQGVEELTGAPVKADDLRAGAAMIIAGLMARGTTEIEDIIYIDRGYEDYVEKLRNMGADIYRKEIAQQNDVESAG